jgi:hypothetical protein
MTALSVPQGFTAGGAVPKGMERRLLHAGFVPGYPLCALAHFDFLQLIHVLSGGVAIANLPLMPLMTLVPTASDKTDIRAMPMRLEEVRRIWQSESIIVGGEYWLLRGYLDAPTGTRWYLNRLRVARYVMRAFLNTINGYVQFVPEGSSPKLGPICEGLPWASASSRIPPPR